MLRKISTVLSVVLLLAASGAAAAKEGPLVVNIVTSRSSIAALRLEGASWLLVHADGGGKPCVDLRAEGGTSARLTRPGSPARATVSRCDN